MEYWQPDYLNRLGQAKGLLQVSSHPLGYRSISSGEWRRGTPEGALIDLLKGEPTVAPFGYRLQISKGSLLVETRRRMPRC